MRRRPVGWLMVVLSLVVLAGCSGGQEPASERTLDLEERWELSPGMFAEVNLEMRQGEAFQASLAAGQPLAWDVHTHGQGGVEILDNGTGGQVTVTFQAAWTGTYSLLAENTGGNATTLTVILEGTGRVVSTVP